jgi:hypothetical protein
MQKHTMADKARNYGYKVAAFATTLLPAAAFAGGGGGDPVVEAITDVGTKVTTYASALVTLAVIAVGFMIGIKFIKKAVSAA